MPRDEFVAYLERYAAESAAPIREHVATNAVQSLPGDGFVLHTSVGDIYADAVVLATGAYQRPHRPLRARTLPPELVQIDVDDYRNEQALPPVRTPQSLPSRSLRRTRPALWALRG